MRRGMLVVWSMASRLGTRSVAEELHIQTKYAQFVGTYLSRFKKQNTYLWNFRCPVCGDSERDVSKARGYLYKNKNGLLSYQCHNCGDHRSFSSFLKYVSESVYREYRLETFKGGSAWFEEDEEEPDQIGCREWQTRLTPLKDLSKIHISTQYVKDRQIPESAHDRFWYTPNFGEFLKSLELEQHAPFDPRLLLVESDVFGALKIIIARAINPDAEMRYVTITTDDNYPKLFGLGRLDYTKQIYVVEGAIDSLFIPNCIATLDSNLRAYQKCDKVQTPVLIWDNEPRSVQIVSKMRAAVLAGESVVIWPDGLQYKDINDMVKGGVDFQRIINTNVYKGPLALLRLANWKKTNATKSNHRPYTATQTR